MSHLVPDIDADRLLVEPSTWQDLDNLSAPFRYDAETFPYLSPSNTSTESAAIFWFGRCDYGDMYGSAGQSLDPWGRPCSPSLSLAKSSTELKVS